MSAARIHKLTIASRVLVYQDSADKDYVAHALELDLIGFGDSPNKALTDLRNAIEAQVSFAIQKNAVDSLYHMAPEEEIRRWEMAAKNALSALADGDVSLGVKYMAKVIELDAREIAAVRRAAKKNPFTLNASAGCDKAAHVEA